MLRRDTRKKFLEHDWKYIQKNESNLSQSSSRIRDIANEALRDLALLAEKLPDEKLQEIFTDRNMDTLILRLLKFAPIWLGVPVGRVGELDSWRTLLSAGLVEKCIYFCMNQYELLEEDSPEFTEETIKQLKQAIKKCSDIARGVELRDLKRIGAKDKLIYLFNWNRIPGSDEKKLQKFLQDEAKITDFQYDWKVTKLRNDKELSGEMIFEYGEPVPATLEVRIILEKEDKANAFFNQLDENKKLKKVTLIVKEQRGQKFIYKENK